MKRIKPSLALIAISIAVSLSSFEYINPYTQMARGIPVANVWYAYAGPQTAAGRCNRLNYLKMVPQPSDIKAACPSADDLCAVNVADSGTNPAQFTPTFCSAIETAVSTNTETASIELKVGDR